MQLMRDAHTSKLFQAHAPAFRHRCREKKRKAEQRQNGWTGAYRLDLSRLPAGMPTDCLQIGLNAKGCPSAAPVVMVLWENDGG